MRIVRALTGLAALSLAACGQGGGEGGGKSAAGPSAAAPAPGRMDGPKPGLWRVTTEVDGIPKGMMPPVETCIGRQAFAEMLIGPAGQMPEGVECSERTFRREGDAMVGHSVCTSANGIRTESDTQFTGDFDHEYTMEVRNRIDPPPSPSMAGTYMKATAERIGDCPANPG